MDMQPTRVTHRQHWRRINVRGNTGLGVRRKMRATKLAEVVPWHLLPLRRMGVSQQWVVPMAMSKMWMPSVQALRLGVCDAPRDSFHSARGAASRHGAHTESEPQ